MGKHNRYPSDLTDAQWELIEPLVPAPRSGGRPAVQSGRRVVDAILYVNRTGCAWRQLPHNFPPWPMVFWYHQQWREDGVVDRLHDALRHRADASDRDPMTAAGCMDAESVNRPDTVAAAVRGFDSGKKVNGRKHHRVVGTMRLSLRLVNASASVQNRGRARTMLDRLTMAMPSLLWADGGYAGKLVDWSDRVAHITVEIVRKRVGIKMFQALAGPWVAERTFARIVKNRRHDHDYERLPQTNKAMIKWAMIGSMVRRLEPSGRKPWQRASTAA